MLVDCYVYVDGVAWGFVGWGVIYVDGFVSGDGFDGLLDPGSDDLGGFDGGVDFEGWWHLFGWVCVFVFLCLGVKGDLLLPC